MIKMYQAEVLGKLPVIQHFLFGSIIPLNLPPSLATPAPSVGVSELDPHHGHVHSQTEVGWGDCCGIPLPSAFAAAQAERAGGLGLSGPGIRPVPFD
jgi:serine/threonine-protein phosphatase 2A activator